MADQQITDRNWNEIKGKLRERWRQLTEDDLAEARGHIDQLAGIIQRKTGEGLAAIQDYLHEIGSDASSTMGAAAERARQYAGQAAQSVEQVGRQAADHVRACSMEAERFVRDRPGIALGVCFGAGLLTGLFLVSALRER